MEVTDLTWKEACEKFQFLKGTPAIPTKFYNVNSSEDLISLLYQSPYIDKLNSKGKRYGFVARDTSLFYEIPWPVTVHVMG